MTREERIVKIIDELLCLYEVWQHGEIITDNSIVRDALNYIAETRHKNPMHPITASLAHWMREKQMIE
jgi:hypothetical protein